MSETYRKRGSVVRWENGTLVRVTESGVAVEDGEVFVCHPDAERSEGEGPLSVDETHVEQTVRDIHSLIEPPVSIERLIVTDGVAEHECEGRTWRDETHRMHLALTRSRLRALVDSVNDVARIAEALARCEENERDAPPRLRLAPNVAAALIPSLIGLAPPNVELWQAGGGIDGKGHAIAETRIEREPWPNWYRPSYRVRPLRMPLDVRVACDVTEIESDRPQAVALLAPVEGLVLRVLVVDGDRAYPATVRVARIDAVARETMWYPYGGGSFGAEMML